MTPTLRSRLQAAMFMSPRDISLFLRSARTDAAISSSRRQDGDAAAFDAVYGDGDGDPWRSGDPRYLYQRRKYDVLTAWLPPRPFAEVLDLGCGLGLFGRRVAARSQSVLGVDISRQAVRRAAALHADQPNMRFEQGDVRALPPSWAGRFDLILLADTLYYLPPPLTDATLKAIALTIAGMLAPGGLCMLANHFFFAADPDSRLSRRVHQAFAWSPGFSLVSEHRRPLLHRLPSRHPRPRLIDTRRHDAAGERKRCRPSTCTRRPSTNCTRPSRRGRSPAFRWCSSSSTVPAPITASAARC